MMKTDDSKMNGSASAITALALAGVLHALRILMPHAFPGLAGFSPVGAAALFAGAAMPRAAGGLLTTLLGLLLGDLAILAFIYQGRHGFPIYGGWYWVYGSLALATLLGRFLAGHRFGWVKAGSIAVVMTCVHWMLTNTGVWLAGGLELATGRPYPHDVAGYVRCLLNAVPYELRFLAGTLVFGGAAFAAWRLAVRARGVQIADASLRS